MKLWTNNTGQIHKVDDNMLYPRTTYVLPDIVTGKQIGRASCRERV